MASHMSSIGFPIESEDDFLRLQTLAADNGHPLSADPGLYVRWQAGSGAEIWVQVSAENQIVGLNPHFAAESRQRARVEGRLRYANESGLDGAFYAWMLGDDEQGDGLYPFIFDSPDFALQHSVALPRIVDVQLSAFAEELRYYDNEDAYFADQRGESRVGPEAFIPSGLFSAGEGDTQLPQPNAFIAGRVLASELRQNPATETAFQWLRLRTYGGELEVVADPGLAQGQPRVGGLASGSFWLSGRLLAQEAQEE
ncbi:MAG: hypothetical protein ACYC4L_11565 [Chloroflexota bacterium]